MVKIRHADRTGSKGPQNRRLDGLYERSGTSLCRQSDGLLLVIRERTQEDGTRTPYLLLKDADTGKFGYLSTLYRRATEFEDRGSDLRYRIDREPDPRHVRIVCIGTPTRRLAIGA